MSTLDGCRSDLVVYFASTWFDGPAGTDWHIAHALSQHAPVLYVEPPISALTGLRKPDLAGLAALPPLQVLGPRMARLITKVTPGMYRPFLRHLVTPMIGRATRAAVQRLYPGQQGDVAGVVSCRVAALWSAIGARRRLYFATDDVTAASALIGIPAQRLELLESRTLAGADRVAVVSTDLRDRFARAGFAADLVPNGCNPEAYTDIDQQPAPIDVTMTGPVAGFVGHINARIDLSLLEAVAARGHELLIVGPVAAGYPETSRFLRLSESPTVCWVGPRPYEELPRYLRLMDVGLTPYVDSAFNRASFPLKTLEYLAAGRAAVSTPLPANDWLDTPLITIARGADAFAEAVGRSLKEPRTAQVVAARQAFARRHSWSDRARRIAKLLDLVEG